MVKRLRFLALAGALACMAGAAPAASIKAFGLTLGGGGTTLLTIDDLRTPDRVRSRVLTDGTAPVTLDALAFRPQTGELYGYQTRSNTVFLVDRFSGMARSVASTPDGVGASAVGFDFNNSIDAARVVSTDGDNLVFNPNNTPPTIGRFTQLFYEDGDANAGATPRVFANAYTNQVPSASSTVQ
jgi:hypothetical protein